MENRIGNMLHPYLRPNVTYISFKMPKTSSFKRTLKSTYICFRRCTIYLSKPSYSIIIFHNYYLYTRSYAFSRSINNNNNGVDVDLALSIIDFRIQQLSSTLKLALNPDYVGARSFFSTENFVTWAFKIVEYNFGITDITLIPR